MVHRSAISVDDCFLAVFLKIGDHLLGGVAMSTDKEMNMVGHDGASVAGVALSADGISEASANKRDFRIGEQES